MRHRLIGVGLSALGALRADRWAPKRLRRRGAILMFHHVRPFRDRGFAPNRELEITPEYLDTVLSALARAGYRIASLDEAVAAAPQPAAGAPLAVLTFDDGLRDFEEWALPILKRARAPATLYVTTGFADRTAAPWWIAAEEALARLDRIDVSIDGKAVAEPAASPSDKERLGATLMARLRGASEPGRQAAVAELARAAGLDVAALTAQACLDWTEIAEIANEPLVSIGAHTVTHPFLAKLPEAEARGEIEASKRELESRLAQPVRHFAYPVGTPEAAGEREFRLVAEAGFASAVTTRPGMLGDDAPHALPRLSVNGRHQSRAAIDALLTGLPFALRQLVGRSRG